MAGPTGTEPAILAKEVTTSVDVRSYGELQTQLRAMAYTEVCQRAGIARITQILVILMMIMLSLWASRACHWSSDYYRI